MSPRRDRPRAADTLSVGRARAALALLAVAVVIGVLARPVGLILVVLVVALVAFEPSGTMGALVRRARGREAREP